MNAGRPDLDETSSKDKRRFRLSLSRTLTFGITLLFLGSLGSSLWIALDAAQRNTFDLERALAELTVEAAIREVETHIGAAQKQVEFLSDAVAGGTVEADDEQRLSDLMTGALAAAPQVSGIAFVRTDYSVLRAGRVEGELAVLSGSWAHRPEVRATMDSLESLEEPTWRAVSFIKDFREPHVIVGQPVVRGESALGSMFSVVSVAALSGFLDAFDKANGTRSFILYGRDQVLAHPALVAGFSGLSEAKPLPRLADVNDPVLAAIWDEVVDDMAYLLTDSWISGHVVRGPDDDYIYFYRQLDIFGREPWLVGVYFLGSEVDLPIRRLAFAAGIGAAILLLAVVAGLFLARSIARPLQRLAGASQSIRRLDIENVQPLRGSVFSELDVAVKAFDSMLAGLRWFETYVPKSLVLRLMQSGGSSVRSEARQVTILFTDIVDFTRIGAQLPPDRLATLLNEHFTLLAEAIEAEDGTVDKYIGDSIMAFWGAPLDQPDHADRACRAARRIAESLRADNIKRRAAGKQAVKLRAGIHSGLAVVGNIGAPGRVNYTLIGDTVNIAQRLEALGKEVSPDAEVAVLVSADAVAALEADFGVAPLGRFALRGRDEPVEIYRLDLPAA